MDHARESIFFHWSNKTWYFHPIRYDSNRLYRLFVLLAPHIPSFIRIYFYSLPPPPPQRTTIIIQFDSIRIEFGNLNSIEFFLECITHTHTHQQKQNKTKKELKENAYECHWWSSWVKKMEWIFVPKWIDERCFYTCVCVFDFEFQVPIQFSSIQMELPNWKLIKKKSLSLRFFFCCCC